MSDTTDYPIIERKNSSRSQTRYTSLPIIKTNPLSSSVPKFSEEK